MAISCPIAAGYLPPIRPLQRPEELLGTIVFRAGNPASVHSGSAARRFVRVHTSPFSPQGFSSGKGMGAHLAHLGTSVFPHNAFPTTLKTYAHY